MTEYIWLVGPSAIGKQTLISKAMDAGGPLRHDLDLPADPGTVVARKHGWDLRNSEFGAVALLAFPAVQQASHVLIKHQNEFSNPDRLVRRDLAGLGYCACIPDLAEQTDPGVDSHRITVLRADPAVHLERHKKKYPDKEMTAERLEASWPGYRRAAQEAEHRTRELGHVVRLEVRDAADETYPVVPLDLNQADSGAPVCLKGPEKPGM